MKLKITVNTRPGYPVYRFVCTLCREIVNWDLDSEYVSRSAVEHIVGRHRVDRDLVKIKFKELK